ncbi:MAG: acetyl-CoA carboxylase biotin carboxyl carrier protein [Rhodospirillales bacterium]|nr:acetyl-CoA carboxylase biotin carboxyl carrier protein [Rhodospirillales bacterium]
MSLTSEDVEEIVRILDASFVDELRLETKRFRVILRRGDAGWTQETRTLAPEHATPSAIADAPAEAVAGEAPPAAAKAGAPVETQLVGTFYRAPNPGAPPFVEVGSRVEPDTVVGIVEAMKLMNSVHAGMRGTVLEICTDNGQFVERGHVLMRVRREDA